MSTAEDLAHSIRKLVSREHQIGLNHIALAVDPFRLYRVEPRTLLGQKAGHYAHSTPALPDLSVVGCDPFLDELGLVPGGIVPDQHQSFLAQLFELLAAPREELRGYGAHRAAIDEAQPGATSSQLRQIEPVTGESLRVRVILLRFLLRRCIGSAVSAHEC